MPTLKKETEDWRARVKKETEKVEYRYFREWTKNLVGKEIDLTMSKEDVADTFFDRMKMGEYKSISNVADVILKSYLSAESKNIEPSESKIYPFVKLADLTFKKGGEEQIVIQFLNNYVAGKDNQIEYDASADIGKEIAKLFVDKETEEFGDLLYFGFMKSDEKKLDFFKKSINAVCRGREFLSLSDDKCFYQRMDGKSNIADFSSKHQMRLIERYDAVVEECIKSPIKHIDRDMTESEYNEFWNVVKSYLGQIENNLIDHSKLNNVFVRDQIAVSKFYDGDKERLRKTVTVEGKNGKYFTAVSRAINDILSLSSTEEECKLVYDFCNRVEKVGQLLSIKDENGKNYPLNYFTVFPETHPICTIQLIDQITKKMLLTDERNATIVNAKTLIRKSLPIARANPVENEPNRGNVQNVRDVLRDYATSKITNKNGTVDYTNKENFDKFIDQVETYIDDHNFPRSSICISLVAREMSAGRQPINLGEDEKVQDSTDEITK